MAECRLPADAFSAFLEARAFDLYDDPMPDQATLEGYSGQTSSMLLQMAVMAVAPATAAEIRRPRAGTPGSALTMFRVLKRLTVAPAAAQAFLPGDLIDRHGVDRGALAKGDITPGLVARSWPNFVGRHATTLRWRKRRPAGIANSTTGSVAGRWRCCGPPCDRIGPLAE